MTEQTPKLTRHDLEAKIVKHCWEDEAFRKEFTVDPAGAFVKYLQVPAASVPRISVHQEEPGSWHIVLPVRPASANELSEADLEKMAGGAIETLALSKLVAEFTGPVASGVLVAGATVVSGLVSADQAKGW
jgi:hypothetical protein